MPTGNWIRFEFKEPVAITTGQEQAQVLVGTYAGLPIAGEADVYELFRMGDDGEPVGECQGRMAGTIVDVQGG